MAMKLKDNDGLYLALLDSVPSSVSDLAIGELASGGSPEIVAIGNAGSLGVYAYSG